jgi:hypothetical protein
MRKFLWFLLYINIVIATWKIILDIENNNILDYRFIQIYVNITDIKNSILILININNNHWTWAFNQNNADSIISNYIIWIYII